jgi:hypothetical protein
MTSSFIGWREIAIFTARRQDSAATVVNQIASAGRTDGSNS